MFSDIQQADSCIFNGLLQYRCCLLLPLLCFVLLVRMSYYVEHIRIRLWVESKWEKCGQKALADRILSLFEKWCRAVGGDCRNIALFQIFRLLFACACLHFEHSFIPYSFPSTAPFFASLSFSGKKCTEKRLHVSGLVVFHMPHDVEENKS